MKKFLALRLAFGRDMTAQHIAGGLSMSWSKRTVQMVLATLHFLHLPYGGPKKNLHPVGALSSVAGAVFANSRRTGVASAALAPNFG